MSLAPGHGTHLPTYLVVPEVIKQHGAGCGYAQRPDNAQDLTALVVHAVLQPHAPQGKQWPDTYSA